MTSVDGRIYLERTDKVIWAQEKTSLEQMVLIVMLKPGRFCLFNEIAELSQSTCLKVKLKNGAEYELPFVAVEWETVEMPTEYHDRILFKIEDLMLTTLRN